MKKNILLNAFHYTILIGPVFINNKLISYNRLEYITKEELLKLEEERYNFVLLKDISN